MSAMSSELVLAVTRSFFDSSGFQGIRRVSAECANLEFDLDVPESDPACPWQNRLRLLSNLRDAIHRNKPDYVFVPSGDAQNIALGFCAPFSRGLLSASAASECIIHWGYGPGPMDFKSRLKRSIYDTSFSWSSWKRLNFVNFLLYELHTAKDRHRRVGMVPDPIHRPPVITRQEARRLLGVPDDGRMIGFIGGMDGRKGNPGASTSISKSATCDNRPSCARRTSRSRIRIPHSARLFRSSTKRPLNSHRPLVNRE